MLPHIMNANGTISILIEGKMENIDTAHRNYEAIKSAIKNGEWDRIPKLTQVAQNIQDAIDSSLSEGVDIVLENGEIKFQGTPIHNTLTRRILDMYEQDFDISFMVKFLENLMKNPSFRAVNELYDFLEAGSMPITENGTFLTYKKIRNNWTDIHSGKFDNSIGAVCEMPRNMVDEDSSRTCSTGLHVCSYDYLPHFASSSEDRVVICEVDPSDVVAIPQDYNNTKMRVCKYKVIGEVEDYKKENALAKNAVIFTSDISPEAPDVCSEDAKEVGKQITRMLDDGIIDADDVDEICQEAYLDNDDYDFSFETRDHKGIGKKVAKMSINGEIDFTHIKDSIDEIYENSIDDAEDEAPTDMVCPRCGSNAVYDGECTVCGYFIV